MMPQNESTVIESIKIENQNLTKWYYGEGKEGIKFARKGNCPTVNAVLIDLSFPWWFQAAHSEHLTIYRIWLVESSEYLTAKINEYVRGVPVETGQEIPGTFADDWARCNVVLIGGRIPDALTSADLWSRVGPTVVITTQAGRWRPPKPWYTQTMKLSHSSVGGTTNVMQQFVIHHRRSRKKLELKFERQISQDLRWILKMGVDGVKSDSPKQKSIEQAGSKVIYKTKGVVQSNGLFPMDDASVQVCTELYNNRWVIRNLTLSEKLMLWDVPERLIRQCNEEELLLLLAASHTPLKLITSVLVAVKQCIFTQSVGPQDGSMISDPRNLSPSKWGDTVVDWEHPIFFSKWNPKLGGVNEVSDEEVSIANTVDDNPEILNVKATKSDNAEVPVQLWNKFLLLHLDPVLRKRNLTSAFEFLRTRLLCRWRRNVLLSYIRWKESTIEDHVQARKSKIAALDCIVRCCGASWWAWDIGSRPLFWRWPVDYQLQVRDGVSPWYLTEVKTWRRPQRPPKHPDRMPKIQEKLQTVRSKGYVSPGKVLSLMSFFEVPKGDDDVRMVYDGTASGLNNSIWAPWFPLPTVDCLIRAVEPGYCMADNDVAEMFHNYMLHESMQNYCGLDLSLYFPEELQQSGRRRLWEKWNRLAMGLTSSPYSAVQGMMIAEEVILGDPKAKNNVFRWDRMQLNLPGSENYNPSKAWVSKVRVDGSVAADVFTYVDDIRTSAPTIGEAWLASQRTSTTLGFLGIQDAARKRRDPGEETGAWTGSIVWTTNHEVSVMTSQEKWDKTRNHLSWIKDCMQDPRGIENKQLQSCRGFLVYVARTYPVLVPYLKGIHATIDSWRPGRDVDGWRYKRNRSKRGKGRKKKGKIEHVPWDPEQQEVYAKFGINDNNQSQPEFVMPVPRLSKDIEALVSLCSSPTPPKRKIRMQNHARVVYGFGDASKRGFGATIELPGHNMYWKCGQWSAGTQGGPSQSNRLTIVQELSSNYRELHNLVLALEEAATKGWLTGQEIFMFTDNSTAEAAYFKGTSSSEQLFYLVLRMRQLQMSYDCLIHLVHIAGTRMIWQGTDGLSRGDFTSGVMGGEQMLSFVPLHLNVFERSSNAVDWIMSWCPTYSGSEALDDTFHLWTHNEWPLPTEALHTYLWYPPPAGAEVAAEFLAKSIHKRPSSVHIFVCPRLMTARWFRLVNKASDFVVDIPVRSPIWNASQHEPLIMLISLPLSRSKPWRHRLNPTTERTRAEVQKLLGDNFDRSGIVLRKFLLRAWDMAAV